MSKYCYLVWGEDGHLMCTVNHRNHGICELDKKDQCELMPINFGVDFGKPGGDHMALSIRIGKTLYTFVGEKGEAIYKLLENQSKKHAIELASVQVSSLRAALNDIGEIPSDIDRYNGELLGKWQERKLVRSKIEERIEKLEAHIMQALKEESGNDL